MIGLIISPYDPHTNEAGNARVVVAITADSFAWLCSKVDDIMSLVKSELQNTSSVTVRLCLDKLFGNN